MRRSAEECAVAEPSMRSTISRQQAALARAPASTRLSSSSLGTPTARNSAGHIAASVFRATLTTMSWYCGSNQHAVNDRCPINENTPDQQQHNMPTTTLPKEG